MLTFETSAISAFFRKFENVWFTSDTHFSHRNIINLSSRPFILPNGEPDVDTHDQILIENINACVGKNDLLIHHGDVALGKIAESLPLVGLLNGTKVLLPGNHDRIFSGEKEKSRLRFSPEYGKVFNLIWPEIVHTYIPQLDSQVVLSHFPPSGDSHDEDRHQDKRPEDRKDSVFIHGHTHSDEKVSRSEKGSIAIHVGVDSWDYKPVHHSEIADLINAN